MSGASNPLAPGRQREIAERDALDDIDAVLARLRDALPSVNDETLRPHIDKLSAFAAGAALVMEHRPAQIDQAMVDRLASLLSDIGQVRLPVRDRDLGFTQGLDKVTGAQGQMVIALRAALDAAKALGIEPSKPDELTGAEVPRALTGKLTALFARMDILSSALDRLDAVSRTANAGPVEQRGLVNLYVGEMKVEQRLALLSLTIGDTTIDFDSLIRAVEAMVRLTGDFLATLRGWAERVSASIQTAAEGLLHPVRRVARGVRASVGWLAHKFQQARRRSEAEPPPDFSMDAVRELILPGAGVVSLAGAAPTVAYGTVLTPGAGTVSLAGAAPTVSTGTVNTTVAPGAGARCPSPALPPPSPQARLSTPAPTRAEPPPDFSMDAVRALVLAGKAVPADWVPLVTELDLSQSGLTDATPLAGLTALQSLDLRGTKVSDVTPLAGLAALQILDLRVTQVSDATPLAGLTALQTLDLGGTQVTDATPLAGLTALQRLDLNDTQVSDATPLAGLTALQTLDLGGTQVSDAAPLAGLAALQSLDLRGTQVSDATPLAGLTALEELDLKGTRVTDVSPLRQPKLKIRAGPGGPLRTSSAIRRRLFNPKP